MGDSTVRTAKVWRKIRQHEGLRQGGPLSCLLAGVRMARQMRATRNQIDWQNGVLPNAQDASPERQPQKRLKISKCFKSKLA